MQLLKGAKRKTFLTMALGAFMVTGFSTGQAEASWSAPRCALQCTTKSCTKDAKRLNDCITNCKGASFIQKCLIPTLAFGHGAKSITPNNQQRTLELLKSELHILNADLADINLELENYESGKNSKNRKAKIEKLSEKKPKVMTDIEDVKALIEKYKEYVDSHGSDKIEQSLETIAKKSLEVGKVEEGLPSEGDTMKGEENLGHGAPPPPPPPPPGGTLPTTKLKTVEETQPKPSSQLETKKPTSSSSGGNFLEELKKRQAGTKTPEKGNDVGTTPPPVPSRLNRLAISSD